MRKNLGNDIMIEIGLVIASPWIEKIFAGEKTWEIRSKPNTQTGRIALAKKGGPLVGTCTIGRSIALSPDKFAEHFEKHRVSPEVLATFYAGKSVYAWPLSEVRRFPNPIMYWHPGGGSWFKLSPDNVPDFGYLQGS